MFAEAIQGAFHVEEHLPESLETLGEFLVAQVLGDPEPDEGFNALRVLLLASTSPLAASAVSARFRVEFVEPLARKLRGKDSLLRAELIGAYVIGLATMRHLLALPALASTSQKKTAAFIGTAIQACVNPPA